MDTLRAMQAFVHGADLGSLSKAARALGTTQPTVSKLVAALERELGVRLLQRSTTSLAPTEEGRRFLERARRLLEDWDEARSDARDQARQPQGLLRVSAPVALGVRRLNALMPAFLDLHPQVELELVLEDRFVQLREERIDLAVRIGGRLPPDLVAKPLGAWPRVLVAAPAYLERHGTPRRPQDLAQHDYLPYLDPDTRFDEHVELDGPGGAARVPVHARYRVNSAVATLQAALAGAGIAPQPMWMVDDLLAGGQLVRVLPRHTGPAQVAHLLHAPRRVLPARVQAMGDFLVEQLGP